MDRLTIRLRLGTVLEAIIRNTLDYKVLVYRLLATPSHRLKLKIKNYDRSERVTCLLGPYLQTTTVFQTANADSAHNASHARPYSEAEPSAARIRPETTKCTLTGSIP